jgi:hypothetical protein
MAAILGTADGYANQNFVDIDCSEHLDDKPNINNPCICTMAVGEVYVTPTDRVFMRINRNIGEICNDNDWIELKAALTNGTHTVDKLNISAGTATKSQINLVDGVEPTTKVNGDIWREGAAIHVYLGSAEYTLDMTAV